MEKTIFEKIAEGEIPSHIIWEDEKHIAFLDINPLTEGHTLVVPRTNIGDYLFEMEKDSYQDLMLASKKVAQLLKEKLESDRILVIVEGYEVPHVHIHLIPSYGVGFTEIMKQKDQKPDLEKVKQKILSK